MEELIRRLLERRIDCRLGEQNEVICCPGIKGFALWRARFVVTQVSRAPNPQKAFRCVDNDERGWMPQKQSEVNKDTDLR